MENRQKLLRAVKKEVMFCFSKIFIDRIPDEKNQYYYEKQDLSVHVCIHLPVNN